MKFCGVVVIGDVMVTDAKVCVTALNPRAGSLSMTIRNLGCVGDTLCRLKCSSSERTIVSGTGVDKVETSNAAVSTSIELPSNRSLEIGPSGGFCVTSIFLEPLCEDDTILVELEFERAGIVPIQALVQCGMLLRTHLTRDRHLIRNDRD